MKDLFGYLLIYTIGGLTFPLILAALIFAHVYFVLPVYNEFDRRNDSHSIIQPGDDVNLTECVRKSEDEKFVSRDFCNADVAAEYFIVSRDYIPGGTNGRPPERATPIGSTVVSAPSQSVYQSMYRSIFERKQNINHSERSYGVLQKKGRNIFFVVLRHGHLMLFDDDEQLEVRHVISLAHYNVSLYAGGDDIPEGEVFIKRNAICLSRRRDVKDLSDGQISKPFYLFSDNCSMKEDFYFALLRNQEKQPKPLQYEMKDIITLVQKLYSSEEHLQTRWLNAITGRIFLALYKTSEVEEFFRAKIKKKISRVKTPGFLSEIVLRKISMGESAPIITNPKLKDLTVNGELVVEADIRYSGNFRIEVAATARIDFGTRFKVREVNLLLAVNLKKIEGHILLKIKPPPSNRFWVCFQTQPRIDMNIEPIVSSRQITYTLILRQIESRIKEVVAESLVYPYWDDSPFFGTEKKATRAGVWENNPDKNKTQSETNKVMVEEHKPPSEKTTGTMSSTEENNIQKTEREETLIPPPYEAKINSKTVPLLPSKPMNLQNSSSAFSSSTHKSRNSSINSDISSRIAEKSQNPLLSSVYLNSTSPIVCTDSSTADAYKNSPNMEYSNPNSAFSALSQMNSPLHTTVGSPSATSRLERSKPNTSLSIKRQYSEKESDVELSESQLNFNNNAKQRRNSSLTQETTTKICDNSFKSENTEPTPTRHFIADSRRDISTSAPGQSSSGELKRLSIATMNSAAVTARKWGWNALHRNFDTKNDSTVESSPSRPLIMGRGQPLPPPGIPLPPPIKKKSISVSKRKTIPIPESSRNFEGTVLSSSAESSPQQNSLLTPLEASRKYQEGPRNQKDDSTDDSLLIVPSPIIDPDEEGSVEDEKIFLNSSKSSIVMCDDLTDQILLGGSSKDDQSIPLWMTTPERDVRAKSMFTE